VQEAGALQELLAREQLIAQLLLQLGREAAGGLQETAGRMKLFRSLLVWNPETSDQPTPGGSDGSGSTSTLAALPEPPGALAASGSALSVNASPSDASVAAAVDAWQEGPPAVPTRGRMSKLMAAVSHQMRLAIARERQREVETATMCDAGVQTNNPVQDRFLAFMRGLAGSVPMHPMQHRACVDAVVRIFLRGLAEVEAQEAAAEQSRAAAKQVLGSAASHFLGMATEGISRAGSLQASRDGSVTEVAGGAGDASTAPAAAAAAAASKGGGGLLAGVLSGLDLSSGASSRKLETA
jgi:hypothetical protein